MTLDDFFQALEIVQDQFDWRLIPEPNPMTERRPTPRLVLRARPKRAPETVVLDPVAVVWYAGTGQLCHWQDAAAPLHLNLYDAATLVAASNDNTFSGSKGQRKPDDELLAIRRRMLEIVGEVSAKRAAGRG